MAMRRYLPAALLLTALLACLPTAAAAVEQKKQAITFTSTAPSSATIGGPTYAVTATGGGSGNPVVFTIDATSKFVCAISGSTVSFTGAGTCTIDANQAGSSTWEAAPQKQQSFTVAKKAQAIAFTSTAPSNATVGGSTYTVTATGGGSGNPVVFTIDSASSSVCTISGSTVSFVGAGTCTIDANQAGSEHYNAAPQAQQPVNVGTASQTCTFTSTAPSKATVGGATYTVTATGGPSGNPVTFTIDVASKSVCAVSGSTVSFTGAGTCSIDANQASSANYNAASQAQQLVNVGKASQTITFTSTAPTSATVGGPTYTVTATGGASGNPVTFTIDAASKSVCTVSGSTVSFTGAGTCTIDANQASSANYNAASQVQQPVNVGKASQTITFTSTAPSNATAGGPTYTVTATGGGSGNPVVFTIDSASSSVCTISGSTASFIGAGTCTIDANQAGNENYETAPQVQQPVNVGKGSQAITFTSTAPSNATVGGPTYTVTATGGPSGNPVVFTSDPASTSVCTVSGSTVSFTGAGTCTIDANQAGNEKYNAAPQVQQPVNVGKGSQTIIITSTAPNNATVGGPTYTVTATGGPSGNPVTFTIDLTSKSVCTVSGSTVSFTGKGTCTIDANQAESANYNAAPQAQQPVNVGKGSQEITFTSTTPSNASVGGPTYIVEATASSKLAVSFSSETPSVCSVSVSTVSFAGAGNCTIDANQPGNVDYEAAMTKTQTFAVHQLSQSINFTSNPPNSAIVGGASYTVTATASSRLAVSFSSATPSVCSVSGATVSFVGAGSCTINANQAGSTEYAPALQVQQSFAVGAAPMPPGPPPPIVQIKPPVIPNSSFRVTGATLSLATYAITFTESVADPGTFSWVLTFENGKFGLFGPTTKKCKTGSIRLKGKCRPAKVLFGRGNETVGSAGNVTFTVRPTGAGVKALRKAFKQNKGLPVVANVTFQSLRGGQPVSRVQSLIVKGKR
jgi:hypothetical protein